ncbi:hypothetical protein ACHHYP_15061 [Achlya hypogyna]|uniref:WRKY19-like zinc finger domain-containing protein n=1 Tax=Achlya hypogyna TaxID=1202772 RepID=A0A1V9YBP7_ACHHY|nr:hypothetical protein ACHHYP_15061 [Achlya hypogyna]
MSTSVEPTCFFHGCTSKPLEGSVKCHFHRNRGLCRVPNCRNQVYARNLCVRHGGRHPCASPGCSTNARLGQFCCRHSKLKKLCHYPGCTKVIQINNLCIRHGGSKNCQYEGCATPARCGGYCWRHRKHIKRSLAPGFPASQPEHKDEAGATDIDALLMDDYLYDALASGSAGSLNSSTDDLDASILDPTTCYFHGCTSLPMEGSVKCHFHRNRGLCRIAACRNQVYARSLCVRHGGRHPCAHPGCSTNARLGDYCCRHSRLKKLCHHPGCTKVIQIHNRCIRHGGSKRCLYPGCATPARSGGHCWRHRMYIKNPQPASPEASDLVLYDNGSEASDVWEEQWTSSEDLDASILEVLLSCGEAPLMTPFQPLESRFRVVTLLSTTEGRTKFYRFLQYTAKSLRIAWFPPGTEPADKPRVLRWFHAIEAMTASARKANRLFRFLDMYVLFPTVRDADVATRRLRQARVLAFFFMFLFENLSILYPTATDVTLESVGLRFRLHLSRWCHTAWLVSILMGMVLDVRLRRGSPASTLKTLLELPIATILALRLRVSDPLMCALGLSSALLSLGLHSHRISAARHAAGCDRHVDQPPASGSIKCNFHKNRGTCSVANCRNQVYARHLCVGHGGRRPCQTPACLGNARVGGYCNKHGGKREKPPCIVDACVNTSYSNGRCIRHGGRRQCLVETCETHARTGGYCWRHSRRKTENTVGDESDTQSTTSSVPSTPSMLASTLTIEPSEEDLDALDSSILECLLQFDCRLPVIALDCFFHKNRNVCSKAGCRNQVYARMLCVGHGGRKPCIMAGCSSSARVGSYCCRHGPKPNRKLCIAPGCPNVRHTGGKCIRHGGGRRCRMHGCETHARTGGFCWRHRVQSADSMTPNDDDDSSSTTSANESNFELEAIWLATSDELENDLLNDEALDSYFDLLLQSTSVATFAL